MMQFGPAGQHDDAGTAALLLVRPVELDGVAGNCTSEIDRHYKGQLLASMCLSIKRPNARAQQRREAPTAEARG